MTRTTFSHKEAFSSAWKTFTERPWFFVVVTIVLLAVSMIGSLFHDHHGLIAGVLSIAFVVVSWWLYLGALKISLNAFDKKSFAWGDLVSVPGDVLLNYAIATVVYGVAVCVGLFLFVVPGVFLAVIWGFYAFLVLEKNEDAVKALKESVQLTKGYRFDIFLFLLLLILINIIGGLLLGIGLLVSLPVSIFATIYVYRWLQKHPYTPAEVPMPAQTTTPLSTESSENDTSPKEMSDTQKSKDSQKEA